MSHDFANDPRFVRLPQKFIDELKQHPPTGGAGTPNSYQEVQFDIGGFMMQCAVLAGEFIPAGHVELDQLQRIIKVWHPDEF